MATQGNRGIWTRPEGSRRCRPEVAGARLEPQLRH